MTNWKRKFTSRKFWAAVAGFVGPLLLTFGVSNEKTTQITGVIVAGASVIAYILGEGLIDAINADGGRENGENE